MHRDILENYGFSDGQILDVKHINNDDVRVIYNMWDNRELEFYMSNCWYILNKKAIGIDIEDVRILLDSKSIKQVREDIYNTGGSAIDVERLFEIQFISSWDDVVVLKLVAEELTIRDL